MHRPREIHVIAELERYQVKYDWAGENEVKVRCPFHEDERPSCDVSVTKRVFKCHAANCGKTGDVVTLLAAVVKRPRAGVLEELATRYDLDDTRVVEQQVVERWHERIWAAKPLLEQLYARGLTDADVLEHRLGEDGGRVTIPVPNEHGDVVNVRKYLPGAPGDQKMRNMRGRGSSRFFPVDQLRYDRVMLCGGEMKAVVAKRLLNPHGMGALCATQAEALLPPELLRKLAGKGVWVCMDVDAAGRAAAEVNCRALKPLASAVYDALLPLDLALHPKGDVNDFVVAGGDLWALVCEVTEQGEWQPTDRRVLRDTEPEDAHLATASNARFAGRRVRVTGIVTAMDTAPYVVPKDVTVTCDKSQGAICPVCPVWSSSDGRFAVHPEHQSILAVVSANRRTLRETLMEAVGVPARCRVCEIAAETYYNAEDVRLAPQLQITERAADQKVQPAICIGEGMETNQAYRLTGRMWPHPATQQSTLLISSYEMTQDALSNYVPRDLELLDAFRPREWTEEAVREKLDDIYDDIEHSVTGIFMRRDLHLLVDLVYHSPLHLTVDGRVVKGWAEALVLGDSSQGKSETVNGMMRHYGLGEKVECKNATVAGLLGGLEQMGSGRWFVRWGFVPMHDKGLVFLEELKGADTRVISKLTDMRTSGVAEIPKIEKRRTLARTRIIAASNPRQDGRTIGSYSFGVEAVKELVGALEDIRRFDAVMVLSSDEVDAGLLNQLRSQKNGVPPRYPAELCRALVLWSWTRRPEQAALDDEATALCMEEATRLCEEFTDAVPVVDQGSQRYKVARLAAALACRTFSADESRQAVVVRPCHVRCVAEFLRRTYSTRAFGYREYTQAVRADSQVREPAQVRARIAALPFPYEVTDSLLRTERVELQDLMDWCGWTRDEASELLSFLVRRHALRREGRWYRKTPAFIAMLRTVAETRAVPDRPGFMKEEF